MWVPQYLRDPGTLGSMLCHPVFFVVVAVECPLSAKQWTLSGSWKKWESGPPKSCLPTLFSCPQPPSSPAFPLSKTALERNSGLFLVSTRHLLLGQNWSMVADYSASLLFWSHGFHGQILSFHCWTHKGSGKHPLGWLVRPSLEPLAFIMIYFASVIHFKLFLCSRYQKHGNGQDRHAGEGPRTSIVPRKKGSRRLMAVTWEEGYRREQRWSSREYGGWQ